jgi:uroporphyrinogen-III decarboxylase
MRRLIMPVREHGLLAAFHTGGGVASVLPMVHSAGFGAVHGLDLEYNDLPALRGIWAGKLAFMGGVPSALLRAGTRARIEAVVRQTCSEIGLAGGYVIGSSAGITDAVPVDNFLALVEAAQRYGRRSTS